jgi:hypothetical protein
MPTEDEGKGETDSIVHENRERAQMFVAGVVIRGRFLPGFTVLARDVGPGGEAKRSVETVGDAILELREIVGGAISAVDLAGAVVDPPADSPVAFRQELGIVSVAEEVLADVTGERQRTKHD